MPLSASSIILLGTTESTDVFPEFNGKRNVFAAKFDTNGNLLWKKIIKHTGDDDVTDR